jgi:hypothetical protein
MTRAHSATVVRSCLHLNANEALRGLDYEVVPLIVPKGDQDRETFFQNRSEDHCLAALPDRLRARVGSHCHWHTLARRQYSVTPENSRLERIPRDGPVRRNLTNLSDALTG